MPDFPDEETSALLAKDDKGGNAPPFSVSEISSALKRTVEDRFGHVRVRGEISGFKRAASGHLYFSLKDADAKLDGVMWKGNSGRLPFAPEDGLAIAYIGSVFAAALAAFIPFVRAYGLPRNWKPSPRGMGKLTMRSLPIAAADAIGQ